MSYPLDPVETIDEHFVRRCGETEASKGFREDWQLAAFLDGLADHLSREERFTADRIVGIEGLEDKSTVHALVMAARALRNNYVGTKFMLIVSEISEAMESLRDHGVEGTQAGEGNVGEELSDAHIRLFALEHLLKLPSPGQQMEDKMKKNSNRPHKHGRAVI